MPPVEFPGILRVVHVWGRPQGDDVVETFHVTRPAEVTLASLHQYAEDHYDWLATANNAWRMLKRNDNPLRRVIVYDLQPGSAIAGEFAGSALGGSSSAYGPHQSAVVITWLTPFRGARWRGRTYVGPAIQSWIGTDGRVTNTHMDTIAAAGAVLVGRFAAVGTPMRVVSFTGGHAADVIGLQVDNSPDVVRKRKLDATARKTEHSLI